MLRKIVGRWRVESTSDRASIAYLDNDEWQELRPWFSPEDISDLKYALSRIEHDQALK